MGNILSYLKWRGDLTFAERPFCEVDNLILAELSYADFSGIVSGTASEGSITAGEAVERFLSEQRQGAQEFLSALAASNRYRNVRLSNYKDIFDAQSDTQFAALHIALEDDTVYIAFRGTSDSLVGWREDFSMSFQKMPSQEKAAAYLAETMAPGVRYRVGGHSKGGNLAVYSAMTCPEALKEQIIAIYTNDGPGLCPEITNMEGYDEIKDRIIRIVPEFSVIGSLFEQAPPTKIVRSSAAGLMQHEGITWEVEGDHFVECPRLSKQCMFYNEIFDQWLQSATLEQRKVFVRDFFDALAQSGATSLSQVMQGGIEDFEVVLLSIARSESKTKIVIGKFLESFLDALGRIHFWESLKQKKSVQGLLCFLIGLVLMAVCYALLKGGLNGRPRLYEHE